MRDRRSPRSFPSRWALLVALAAPGLLAACGSDGGGGSASVEAWCDLMDEANEVDTALSGVTTASPDEIRAAFERANEVAGRLVSAAPDEIADEARTIADSTKSLGDALEAADYSLFDADLSAVAGDQEAIDAAGAELDEFSLRECGQPFGNSDSAEEGDAPSGTDSDFDLGAGTLREQLVTYFVSIGLEQSEAECLAAQADSSDTDLLAGDTAAIMALFEECDIPLDRLAELGG